MTDRKAVQVDPVAEAVAAERADERAQVAEEVAERRLDETVEGGRYRTADGRFVNAEGEEIK